LVPTLDVDESLALLLSTTSIASITRLLLLSRKMEAEAARRPWIEDKPLAALHPGGGACVLASVRCDV